MTEQQFLDAERIREKIKDLDGNIRSLCNPTKPFDFAGKTMVFISLHDPENVLPFIDVEGYVKYAKEKREELLAQLAAL